MNAKKVKIGIIQSSCTADKQENLEKAVNHIRQAAAKGAQIICLQELFSSLYFCDTEDWQRFSLAEAIPEGETTRMLQKLGAELQVVIVASLFEKRTSGIYHNTIALIDADGKYLGKYRKNHIPDDPGYYEKFYFTPGDSGYKVFDTKYAKIGTLICWDQWYPEAARITSLMGAEILFYPTAIGYAESEPAEEGEEQFQAWQTIQKSHAIANGVHVVAVNRVGKEGDATFWGSSFICNPFGTVVYQADQQSEVVHVQEIDLNSSEYYRTHWPFLRDRRIETYAPILNRFIDHED
ncbi:MAG: carbon-nitrogen hydrolase [Candidatus Cyclobacteriaceae bacterium M3_2C_046]